MAKRGNKPLIKREAVATPESLRCMRCDGLYSSDKFYQSDSILYSATGYIPYCDECLSKFYDEYYIQYRGLGYPHPGRRAVERICMMMDLYYSDKIYENALKKYESDGGTILTRYMQQVKMYQYRKKNYDTTIAERRKTAKTQDVLGEFDDTPDQKSENLIAAEKVFGTGFSDDDYIYLYEQYVDWTTRHECGTKAQEEVFKRICFKQLEILKATRAGEDTKDLDMVFQKLLDTARLQPKQNKGDTMSETQTFGTLIEKWENTRPLPEIDEELRDVDKIGLYLDVFFKGHLAKMMGLKNGLSNLYTKFMKQYTVEKPEYEEDEDSEALFDAIFGNATMDDTPQ